MVQTKTPRVTAVRSTPRVDKVTPCHRTGLTDSQLVSSPPEKRITFNATIPINCVALGLSKYIPPMLSEPASIPIARKSIRTGIPKRYEVFPAIRDKKSRIAPIRSIFSEVMFIIHKYNNIKLRLIDDFRLCLTPSAIITKEFTIFKSATITKMALEISKWLNKKYPQNYIIRNPLIGVLIFACDIIFSRLSA